MDESWWIGQETEAQQKRNSYWKLLRMARGEFDSVDHTITQPNWEPNRNVFKVWLEETYGVKMFYEGTDIAGQFEIVDEHKYLLLLLKYGDK